MNDAVGGEQVEILVEEKDAVNLGCFGRKGFQLEGVHEVILVCTRTECVCNLLQPKVGPPKKSRGYTDIDCTFEATLRHEAGMRTHVQDKKLLVACVYTALIFEIAIAVWCTRGFCEYASQIDRD